MVRHEAYESIRVDVTDRTATITLCRPAVHNAINDDVILDVRRAFAALELDRDVEVVVIDGEGDDAFSAGADITEYAGPARDHDPEQRDRQVLFYEMCRAPFDCHAPVIAKIDGYCLGGGLILAMFCDVRVASENATFGLATTDIGQIPTGGSTWRAIQLIGEARTKELVYTAGEIDATEAEQIGLVNRTVPADELDPTVEAMVESIRHTGTGAVRNSKRALNYAANSPDVETAREFEEAVWWEQFASEERERLVDEFVDR